MLDIAIVGSGPSGFFAADCLLKSGRPVRVSMFERLPVPFGLVRSGVAPDHPNIKQVARVFHSIAQSPAFRFFGNVDIGRDIDIATLRADFAAVVLACGAVEDCRLNIPGEDLPGSHGASEFVGWYNGHPEHSHRRFDLSHPRAVIVGHGNVAADVCRILLTPVELLERTDLPAYALEALAESRVEDVYLIGRRGPAQSKFTAPELRELGQIPGCDVLLDEGDLELNSASREELNGAHGEDVRRNLAIFAAFSKRAQSPNAKRCHFGFLQSPLRVLGETCVTGVEMERNRLSGPPRAQRAMPLGVKRTLNCGLLFRSVGFRGSPIPGVPFDERAGIVPNTKGRVVDGGIAVSRMYVTGWLKRGPQGVIGSNRADSMETIESLLQDVDAMPPAPSGPISPVSLMLCARGIRPVSYDDWLRIDAAEVSAGTLAGKPREKMATRQQMLNHLGASRPRR